MNNYTNRELILAALENKKLDTIPKFFMGVAFLAKNAGLSLKEYQSDSEVFVRTNIAFANEYGTSMNDAGFYADVAGQIGNGQSEEVIKTLDDIEKLDKYSVENSKMLDRIAMNISLYKKYDAETPTYAGVRNTPMVVTELLGASNYYKKLIRDKKLIEEVSKAVEPLLFSGLEKIAEAGCDVIWLPMPTISGTCISKKNYEQSCHLYSKRFVDKIHQLGMKAIIHTCGNWNDRFDVVMREGADALHLSETNMIEFARKYGSQICMMGNISVTESLLYKQPEQVYEESYQACLDACEFGNYIMAPDCGVPGAVSEANIRAMFQAADKAAKTLWH